MLNDVATRRFFFRTGETRKLFCFVLARGLFKSTLRTTERRYAIKPTHSELNLLVEHFLARRVYENRRHKYVVIREIKQQLFTNTAVKKYRSLRIFVKV